MGHMEQGAGGYQGINGKVGGKAYRRKHMTAKQASWIWVVFIFIIGKRHQKKFVEKKQRKSSGRFWVGLIFRGNKKKRTEQEHYGF